MLTVILNGGSRDDTMGAAIHETVCDCLRARSWEVETKALADVRVQPCVGCFNCWVRTPGVCAANEDGREVVKAVARCDALIFLGLVTFGGYPSLLKHAVDRIVPTISPLFEWVNGEMHHRLRYTPAHRFLAIGWQREPDGASTAIFTKLASRNAINMHAPVSGSAVLHERQSSEERRAQVALLISRLEGCR